ncbi:double zinc ribbon domain-containing protein [Marivita sp. S6314]|uniref:double zinc ribbon domain-containing protein n=1 Tax=Marivita sp. S6314 TaxID=2926406 RepID=UPI001FF10DD3|nr:double zinc ribbon domain-containing protein [Marivita sp. S6314]MCK0151235.1 double zinc ribbon domain-containing protein [Marivita sp. S6314]
MIYPPQCLACGGLVDQEHGLCAACFAETPFVTGLVCDLCGVPLPGVSEDRVQCDDCMAIGRPWIWGRAPLRYDGVARKLVLALKHGDRHDIVDTAADWMVGSVPQPLASDTVVVPVPLHLTRLLKRRYNQSALLAQALARKLDLQFCPDALRRHRRTASLDGKSRAARFAEVADAITHTPRGAQHLKNRPVLLIDDVMTSGATLAACALACHTAQSREICVMVLARVAKAA